MTRGLRGVFWSAVAGVAAACGGAEFGTVSGGNDGGGTDTATSHRDAAIGVDGGAGASSTDDAGGGGSPPADASQGSDADAGVGLDASLDVSTDGDAGIDAPADVFLDVIREGGDCAIATHCQKAYGDPPCGVWECNDGQCEVVCTSCDDDDHDGYGVGKGCAGPDCDDDDDTLFDSIVRSCYTGDSDTVGKGVCRSGMERCVDGAWSPCIGEITPTPEACNGEDDDCDESTDEDILQVKCGIGACTTTTTPCQAGAITACVPGTGIVTDTCADGIDNDCDGRTDEYCTTCTKVSPAGNDGTAVADSNTTPFASIQAAIDWSAGSPGRPKWLCVAAEVACGFTATFIGAVKMKSGVSVHGGFESTGWTPCSNSVTVIQTNTAVGVEFPSSVQAPTTLSKFRIDRVAAGVESAGVTIDGSSHVTLVDLTIPAVTGPQNTYGVDLKNGAAATVTRSVIFGGDGTAMSIGVRSVDAKPTIVDNCVTFDASGRCTSTCLAGEYGIRANYGLPSPTAGEAYGVLLENSPGAIVGRDAICGVQAHIGAGIKIVGDAEDTIVRASFISAWGAYGEAYGISIEGCDGQSPWIVDNSDILAEGNGASSLAPATRTVGIYSRGDCHPLIESNLLIRGGSENNNVTDTTGVHCDLDSGTASRCVIVSNAKIRGAAFGVPPISHGVRCENGACARIEKNDIDGNQGVLVTGLWLDQAGPVVRNNVISGGCGSWVGVGAFAQDSWSRFENNRIFGGSCNVAPAPSVLFLGLEVINASGLNELDVHSNVLDGQGPTATCTSTGLWFGVQASAPATTGLGVFRNNIVSGGNCTTNVGVYENDPAADPRIFESNDLRPTTPAALYVDEKVTTITDPADVDALSDMTVSGTISAYPGWAVYPTDLHLTAGSACEAKGVSTGAPPDDMDGDPRDPTTPDIGPDEL